MNISCIQTIDTKMISANISLLQRFMNFVATYSEYFWFSLLFVLFLVLGPFAIIAVVIGLWNLANIKQVKEMTEPVKG